MTFSNIVHWKIKLDLEHQNIIQNLFLFFMMTAGKNWCEKGSRRGPLQPMQYYLPSSPISCSLQETLGAIPNTHKAEHQRGLHIPHEKVKLQSSCEALVKHSERRGKPTIHVSQGRVNSSFIWTNRKIIHPFFFSPNVSTLASNKDN